MPGKVIGKIMNYGFPGTVSRSGDAVIEVYAAGADIQFGQPVVLDAAGKVIPFGAANTAADFIGVACRTVKQAADDTGEAWYQEGDAVDVLVRGSASVACATGTPAMKGAVNVYTVAVEASAEVGDFAGAAVESKTVALTNVIWSTGKLDAYRNAEITILSRNI